MPGAYTHITMVNVAGARLNLEKIPNLPAAVIGICGRWLRFCELGAVSPDYPYLDLLNNMIFDGSKVWADTMHHTNTNSVIRASAERLSEQQGVAQEKGMAWLLGYTAHVVMDATIHPVINLKVGEYEENKRKHRVCEMNQDVFIYRKKMDLSIKLSEHLRNGIARCSNADGGIDDDISSLWGGALESSYPDIASQNAPQLDRWHGQFGYMVNKIAEEGDWLSAISRHVSRDIGFGYPPEAELEGEYLTDLPTPNGGTIEFEALFNLAHHNVNNAWGAVSRAVFNKDMAELRSIKNWNLDSGVDQDTGNVTFWARGV